MTHTYTDFSLYHQTLKLNTLHIIQNLSESILVSFGGINFAFIVFLKYYFKVSTGLLNNLQRNVAPCIVAINWHKMETDWHKQAQMVKLKICYQNCFHTQRSNTDLAF